MRRFDTKFIVLEKFIIYNIHLYNITYKCLKPEYCINKQNITKEHLSRNILDKFTNYKYIPTTKNPLHT